MGEPLPDFRAGLDRPINGVLALAGRLILVVEDQPLIAADIAMSLEDAGANVVIAHNLAKALELVERGPVSAAIVDFGLSDGEATAFCERLTRANIPFVIYSGNADAKANGGVSISKPASDRELVTTVARLVAAGSSPSPSR